MRSPAGLGLAIASASIAVWQTLHAVALYDVSFVLNVASRISMGDIPYRDFPLPYPPLTFVIQAFLIKLFGPQYIVSVAYAVMLDAAATFVAYAILLRLVRDRWIAVALCLPLVALGTNDVLPNAFYDSDATFLMLLGILLALRLAEGGSDRGWAIVGALLPVVILVKQNSGLAYFGLMLAICGLVLLRERARALWWLAGGAAASVVVGVVILQLTAGLDNVARWTILLASARLASSPPPFGWLAEPTALAALVVLAVGVVLLRPAGRLRQLGLAVVVSPFVMLATSAVVAPEQLALLLLWPIGLSVGAAAAAFAIARGELTLPKLLPIVALGVATAAFVSQGVRGSTYALWPFLILAMAEPARLLLVSRPGPAARSVAVAIGVLAMVSGLTYSLGEYRLGFVRLDGPVATSTYPGLAGLAAPGRYVPEMDQMLRRIDALVPRDDGIVAFPGEDPLFYALGRRPQFPLVAFDVTVDPYTPTELGVLRETTRIRWVLVKRELQLSGPVWNASAKIAALTDGLELVSSAGGYDLYRRR